MNKLGRYADCAGSNNIKPLTHIIMLNVLDFNQTLSYHVWLWFNYIIIYFVNMFTFFQEIHSSRYRIQQALVNVVPLDASSNGNVPVSPHLHELAKAIHRLNNKADVSEFGTKMHTEYIWVKKTVFRQMANTGYSIF